MPRRRLIARSHWCGASISTAGRRWFRAPIFALAASPKRIPLFGIMSLCSAHVRSAHFKFSRSRPRRGESAATRRGAAGGVGAARARRLHRAARRPLSERIRAALRRAARLAHRLHRFGWPRHRPRDRAAIFVDGRYQLQVPEEVDARCLTVEHLVERPPAAWIEANLRAGQKLGYSPWLHTVDGAERLEKAARRPAPFSSPVADNPIDAIWSGRPSPPLGAAAARPALCRRGGGAESRARAGRAEKCRGRRAAGLGPARGLLAVQHSRRRHSAHADRARLCVCRGGPSRALCRPAQAWQRRARPARRHCRRRGADDFECDLAALGAQKRAVRLDPAACPRRSRSSSPTMAARSRAAAIRSRP